MTYFFLFFIVLFKTTLSSKEISTKVLGTVLDSIPTATSLSFVLNYDHYIIKITDLRFFRAITSNIQTTVLDHSIEAQDITLTVACNLLINMERNYTYNDFLIQFKIMEIILTEDFAKSRYTLSKLVLDNMYISNLHDIGASKTFKQFTQDEVRILSNFNTILSSIFEDKLSHQNLHYYDLVDILNKLKVALTGYGINILHQGMLITKVTAGQYSIEKNPAADETSPGVQISRYVKFTMNYTVDGQVNYLMEICSFKCTKKANEHFEASHFTWNKLSEESGSKFYDQVKEIFSKIAKEKGDVTNIGDLNYNKNEL